MMGRLNNKFSAVWLAAFLMLPACAGDRMPAAPANHAPKAPYNPVPIDGASIPITCACILYLTWEADDPDPGDSLAFDIHLGTANPPPLAAKNLTQRYFVPTLQDSAATYYWYIVARDLAGAETAGPVWRFKITAGP